MRILIVYLEREKEYAKRVYNKFLKSNYGNVKLLDRRFIKRILEDGKITYDVTIVVGGDGTFLRTAQFIDKTKIMGVNPRPGRREAFFSSVTVNEFKPGMLDEAEVQTFPRLRAKVNGKRAGPLALNDIYIGEKRPYKTSKYKLCVGRKRETQISSGVVVSTAVGTNSWFKSITGKTFSDPDKEYFAVRDLYSNKVHKASVKMGAVNRVTIKALKEMILVFDSVSEEFRLKEEDKVKIELVKNSLKILKFRI